jgi:hypothetical protein
MATGSDPSAATAKASCTCLTFVLASTFWQSLHFSGHDRREKKGHCCASGLDGVRK